MVNTVRSVGRVRMATKAIKYDIVIEDGEVDLIVTVNHRIQSGWKPVGGPSVFINDEGKRMMMQAIAK
jgi:hypothetical protein